MKKAYTLAEVLICVGIIGVLAAILLPLANKFKPDSNKAIYIKTYDAVVDIVKSMASNNNLYPIIDEEYNYIKAPLYNLVQVKIGGTAYGGDKAKFCQLFALNFPTVGTISCSKDAVTYSESSFDSPSFITSQGMGFIVSTNTDLTTSYQTDIYFDINGKEKGNNCLYDAEKCKNPDRFKLIVSGDGHVIPADPMGIEYLKSKTNWRKSELTPDGALLTSVPDEWKVKPEIITHENIEDNSMKEESSENSQQETHLTELVLEEGCAYNENKKQCENYKFVVKCENKNYHLVQSWGMVYSCMDDNEQSYGPGTEYYLYWEDGTPYAGVGKDFLGNSRPDGYSQGLYDFKKNAKDYIERDYSLGRIEEKLICE